MKTQDKQLEYQRAHYRRNKEAYKLKAINYRESMRQYVRDLKSTTPCHDCGVLYPYFVMDFDHLGDKEFNIGSNYNRTGMLKLKREIAKCELVCSNCHRLRTHMRSLVQLS